MSVAYIDNYLTRAPYKDPTVILVLVALGDCASNEGTLWYAVDRLAKRCRLSPRRFREVVAKLETDGVVRRVERPGTSNLWYLRKFPEEMPAVDTPEEKTPAARRTPAVDRTPTPAVDRTPPLRPVAVKPSLNRQCEPSFLLREAQAPARGGAPAKQSKADPERTALTEALARYPQYFGKPVSANEWKNWHQALTSMMSGGFRAGDVPRAVNAWKRKYPAAQLTINALDKHLGELLPTLAAPTPTPPTYTSEPTPTLTPEPEPVEPQEETSSHVILHTTGIAPAPDRGPAHTPEPAEPQESFDERRRRISEATRARLAEINRRADAQVAPRRARLLAASGAPLQVS